MTRKMRVPLSSRIRREQFSMSCKQIQELLPLYVGRDLEEKRERMIATHLESCTACAAAKDEYRESRQLLQEFAPPAFSDADYANLRRNVLRDIESTESTGPTFAQTIANLFRPRLGWAMATVALIAFALFGLYFMTSRQTAPNPIANKPTAPGQTVPSESPENKNAVRPSGSDPTDHTASNQPRPRRNYRKAIANERPTVAVNAVKRSPMDRNVSPTVESSTGPDAFPARDEGKVMRVEMQTKDPNIRIIWFSQPNTKTNTNSKGS
jgi:hypothetical protein